MPDFESAIATMLPELITFRHDLHAHPETAYTETRTAAKVLEALEQIRGLRIQTGLAGGTGILATLNAHREGPCVLLRADMDALPLVELNEIPHKSTHEGRMHACGHDGHTTCLLGAARVLATFADALPGKVKFCFQPAEEGGAGGQRMVADGVLENPNVDAAFAFHGWPDIPLGQVVSIAGPAMAAASGFEINFMGRGGHAAYPHYATDVLAAAAQFITNAQAIRTRFIDPLDPVVISFCRIEGGHAHNVLPQSCQVEGTLRALSEPAQVKAKQLLNTFLQSTATNFGVRAELSYSVDYPVLINDSACAALVADVATELLGATAVLTKYPPSMGGEDFAFFAQKVPATMYRVGLRPPGVDEYPGLHHPRFDFNDDAIPIAVRLFCAVAERFLAGGDGRDWVGLRLMNAL